MPVNILMLGTLISQEQSEKFLTMGIRPAPADIVQKYLLEGLETDERVGEITVISSPRIPYFPKSKVKKVRGCIFNIGKAKICEVGFNNFPGLGFMQREKGIVFEAKQWAKENQNTQSIVILYSMHSPFLRAAREIKKINPNVLIAMIVPDLPQYMSKKQGVAKILKSIDQKRIYKYLSVVDKYILYTKHMAEYLHLEETSWMVLEGLIDTRKIVLQDKIETNPRVCLYAGSFSTQYAIDKLIIAFEESNVDAELHLYGNSIEASKLMKQFPHCKKTKYMGMLSQSAIFEKMREATLLLNPRPSNLGLAKYSVPSKTFEYMASGTPILMTKLPGIPEEYYSHLYFFADESVASFKEELERVLSYDNSVLFQKGKNAAVFLKENKACEKQTKKILDFCIENRDFNE